MTVRTRKSPSTTGRKQASAKAVQHRDFIVDVDFAREYALPEPPVDLWKQNLRFAVRASGITQDISDLVTNVTWQQQIADQVVNTGSTLGAPLTGTVQLTKPALGQYKQLLPAFLDASIDSRHHVDRWGPAGAIITASVGYGRSYVPVWSMRVFSSTDNQAEQVSVGDGAWTLGLVSPDFLLAQSLDDWKFSAGQTSKRRGWTANEIALAVCKRYKVPVKTLTRGSHRFELTDPQVTHNASPLSVIQAAYTKEQAATGKVFVIGWSAPDRTHPYGGLTVTPLRRNANLLVMRDQLVNAVLTRGQGAEFATVVEATGKLNGKQITVTVTSSVGVKRFGIIHKQPDFGTVSSRAELLILAKRWLARNLIPIRSATLTHPGVATIRSGDAIRIDLPEEGYAQVALAEFATPTRPASTSVAALSAAESNNPTLFGLPDPTLVSSAPQTGSTAAASATSATQLTAGASAGPFVPDQGIVFVTSVQHTVTAGQYQMAIETGFTDMLDPKWIALLNDKASRAAKATTSAPAGAWRVKAVQETTDLAGNSGGSAYGLPLDGYSEMSSVLGSEGPYNALGGLPGGLELFISANGQTIKAKKVDIGAGSTGSEWTSNPRLVMGVYPRVSDALGLHGGGPYMVTIWRADGKPLQPVAGVRV